MHSTTGLYRYLMALPSRTLTTRGTITYPDAATQAITSTHISSWRVTEDAGSNLPIGGVGSASLELKLDNRDGEWNPGGSILGVHELDGAIIDIELGVYDPEYSSSYPSVDGGTPSTTSGSYDGGAPGEVFTETLDGGNPREFPTSEILWEEIGTYVIESAIGQEQEPLLTIKAHDYLANYGATLFSDGLTYPQTIAQILTEACSQASITLSTTSFANSTISIAVKPVWPDNTSCRDVISYAACVAGGFAFINRDGELDIVTFNDSSDYDLTTARYKIFESREDYGAFNSITAESYDTRAETRVEVAGGITDTEHNSILIKGDPLIGSTEIAAILAGMLSALGGLTFDSSRIDWQGDPTVTLGDVLGITDIGTDTYVVPVFKQTLNFDSGFGMSSENDIGTITRKASNLAKLFTSSGRLNSLALEGDIKIKSGENLYLESGGDMEVKSGGKLTISSGGSQGIEGDLNIESGGNLNIKSGGDIEVESGGNINVASGGDIHVESGGDIEIASGGSLAIASGGDLTLSGATVDISTDLFEISNADGETLLEVSSPSGGDPGGQLVLGSESMPIRIGGNFVLPVENGGTGSSALTNRTHYFASYPDNSIGIDGDLGVLVNMASGTYTAITPTHYTTVSGNDTFCGLTRNWNAINPAGWTAVGNANATGTSNLYASAFSFSFTDPNTIDRIAINFDSAKYVGTTWYGWNVSSYITVAVCSAAGAVLGSTTFLPATIETLNSINIECSLEDDTTYYLIMYDNTTSATKSKCIIEIASVTSPAYSPSGYNCGLFVRHGGIWTLLASGSG